MANILLEIISFFKTSRRIQMLIKLMLCKTLGETVTSRLDLSL